MTDLQPQTYGERLLWALNRKGMSQSELARRVGVKPQSVQHLVDPKKNAQGSSHTADFAKALEVQAHWLATGEGSWEQVTVDTILAALKEVTPANFLPEQSPILKILLDSTRGVAHDLSQARNTESLPRTRWEDLMGADLNRPFELEVMDDALAPEIFKGCIAILDPKRPPEPAWPVLVRDGQGNHYLRDYEEGPGDTWAAVARSRGYARLESDAQELTILAAMEGYRRPRRPVA